MSSPNQSFPNDYSHLNFSQLLSQTEPNQTSSSNPSMPYSQNAIGTSSQFPSQQFQSQFPYAPQFFPKMTPEQIYFNQQQAFQQFKQFQQFQSQQVPETQFKEPQPQSPQLQQKGNRGRKIKRMAKKSSIPAVDLSAEDDNIDDEDDVVVTAPQRWTPSEEVLLAQAWVGASENIERGNDQTEDFFWNQIHDDFNKNNPTRRTKNMLTGKWSRMHPDVQKFHAIFKSLNKKSGETENDVVEAAKTEFAVCNTGRKFTFLHAWTVLKNYPKWNAADGLDVDDHTEVFGNDARPRPPGKPRPAKKTKSETTGSSTGGGSSTSKEEINDELLQKIKAGKELYLSRKAKVEADLEFKEMEFLSIKTDELPEPNKSIIKRKQAQIAAKYQLDL